MSPVNSASCSKEKVLQSVNVKDKPETKKKDNMLLSNTCEEKLNASYTSRAEQDSTNVQKAKDEKAKSEVDNEQFKKMVFTNANEKSMPYESFQDSNTRLYLKNLNIPPSDPLADDSRSKSYTCNLCSETFLTKQSIIKHGLFHANHNNCDCSLCSESCRPKECLFTYSRKKTAKHKSCSEKQQTIKNGNEENMIYITEEHRQEHQEKMICVEEKDIDYAVEPTKELDNDLQFKEETEEYYEMQEIIDECDEEMKMEYRAPEEGFRIKDEGEDDTEIDKSIVERIKEHSNIQSRMYDIGNVNLEIMYSHKNKNIDKSCNKLLHVIKDKNLDKCDDELVTLDSRSLIETDLKTNNENTNDQIQHTTQTQQREHVLEEVSSANCRRCIVCYENLAEISQQHAQTKTPQTKYRCVTCNKNYCLGCFFVVHTCTKKLLT